MKNKVLFVSHTSNFVKFNLPFMKWFVQQGFEVHYASAGEEPLPPGCCTKEFVLPFERSPYHISNIKAFRQLKKIIEQEKYQIVHCHTPVGGAVARLAARKNRKKQETKVLYTAHGFHFYKGAPKRNWILYYPVERLLSRFTDCLITLNQEDYTVAAHKRFKAGETCRIDGVGVDLNRFSAVDRNTKLALRQANDLTDDDFVMLYIAEFISRKNHELILRAIPGLREKIPNLKLLLAGVGKNWQASKDLAKELGIEDCVRFLGYCRNVNELCGMSDVMVSASRQEGLPIGVIESMACGLPIICTSIRGQTDVIKDGVNGWLYPPEDGEALVQKVLAVYQDEQVRKKMAENNVRDVQTYSLENAVAGMAKIYERYIVNPDKNSTVSLPE